MLRKVYSGTDTLAASKAIDKVIISKVKRIEGKVAAITYRASNELRTAALYVLSGQRSGKVYRVPFTKEYYTASKAGESPAVRTGIFRLSWGPNICIRKNNARLEARAAIESDIKVGKYILGDILENGTGKMAARPYKRKIIDIAAPKIRELYKSLL